MSKVINVVFEGKQSVAFNYIANDFQLSNLDLIIRSYHGIPTTQGLIYTNDNNDIIIPSSNHKVVNCKRKIDSPVVVKEESGMFIVKFLINYGSAILIILGAITFSNNLSINNLVALHYNKKVFVDCWISAITWSICQLFIRRLLNPESTKIAFVKYSADSFFGGLATAVSAILKSVLVKSLA